MNTQYNFNNQCGIITGPASGIGKSVAILLAKSGAGLTLVDRDRPGLEAITQACKEENTTVPLPVIADVSKEDDVKRLVDETLAKFGRIDFLVTSAGILFRTNFTDIPMSEWDELMDTNVRGLFMCNQFVVREMLKHLLLGTEFEVVGEAENAAEALATYADASPDLVLMDIIMPDVSGIEAVRQLIALDPNVRVVMCSALDQQSTVVESLEAGALDFVTKPFVPTEVLGVLRRVLD